MWREKLTSYIRNEAQPVEKYSHQPRLYALCRQIAEGTSADDDILFAAVWLHDLGVFLGHRPSDPTELERWDNTAYAMRKSPDVLMGFGFPAEKIAAVVECIQNHQPHSHPQLLEAQILRDADILEQLGAVGALRTICKVGRDTRFSTFADAVRFLKKAVDTLPDKIHFDTAKTLAAPRIAVLQHFLQSADAESAGEL